MNCLTLINKTRKMPVEGRVASEAVPKKKSFKDRVNQITAQKHQAIRQQEAAVKAKEQALQQVARLKQQIDQQSGSDEDLGDFMLDEEAEPLTEGSVKQLLKEQFAENAVESAVLNEQRAIADARKQDGILFDERLKVLSKTHPDASKVYDLTFGEHGYEIVDRIQQSPVGAEIAYHIASNTDFANSLKQALDQSPGNALFELGKLEASIQQVASANNITQTPAPMAELKGNAASVEIPDLGDMPYLEYRIKRKLND